MIKTDIEVIELDERAIFFNTQVATFEGGEVVMNVANGTMVIQFKNHPKHEGRYAFSVQAMMNGLIRHLEGKSIFNDLEEYVDSVDADMNTIQNYDMSCCDDREYNTLGCVADALDILLKKHRKGDNDE